MFSRIRFLLILILVLIPVTIPGAAQAQTQTETDFTWLASYWNNRNLAGTPIVRRNESAIDYNWGLGSPDPLIKPNNFSARWTAEIDFNPATYRFAATSDDGMRVWVDGDLIIDQWYDHPVKTTTADKNLGAGPHRIVVEYYEAESGAIARFWWAPAPPADGNNWTGEYFNNTSLSGQPALVRQDPVIGFNWTDVSPGPGIHPEKFSARWTKRVNLPAGMYRFEMTVDDGGRLWVNGHLLIDAWYVQSPHTYSAEIYLPAGSTPIKMEYFNNLLGAMAQLSWNRAPLRTEYWRGEYFDNVAFRGAPALIRNDPRINFDWGAGSPAPGQIGMDHFAVRWTHALNPAPGRYRFSLTTDDGARLWINDRLLIDAWQVQAPHTYSDEINYVSGQPVTVRLEYFENTGNSLIQLSWSKVGQPNVQTSMGPPGAVRLANR